MPLKFRAFATINVCKYQSDPQVNAHILLVISIQEKQRTCILKMILKFPNVNLHFCFKWNIRIFLPIGNDLLKPRRKLCSFMKEKCFLLLKATPPTFLVLPEQTQNHVLCKWENDKCRRKVSLPAKGAMLMVKRPELVRAWVVAPKWDTRKLLQR